MTAPDITLALSGLDNRTINVILSVYQDARADLLHLPHYALDNFRAQLERHSRRPGCRVALAFHKESPIGYAYGAPLREANTWWPRAYPAPPEKITREDGTRTFRIDEIAVLASWRGTGTARRVHDHLLANWKGRSTLMVNPLAGDGKVKAVYESWGYHSIAHAQPSPNGPVLSIMIRPRIAQN